MFAAVSNLMRMTDLTFVFVKNGMGWVGGEGKGEGQCVWEGESKGK